MIFRVTRLVLYTLLFMFSVVLLGLTGYRLHYTLSRSQPDVLTTSTHYYDPRIAALLVGSALLLILSIVMLGMIAASSVSVLYETFAVLIVWIYLLITAALVTRQFSNLKWCRSFKVCSVLEAIKAFSWICWGFLTFVLIATLVKLLLPSSRSGGTTRTTRGSAPAETRQTTTGTTVYDQPRTQTTTQGVPASHGQPTTQASTKNTYQQQSAPVNPQPGNTAGALYVNQPVTPGTVYTERPADIV